MKGRWFLLILSIMTIGVILLFPHFNAVVTTDESVYLKAGETVATGRPYSLYWPDIRLTVPTILGFVLKFLPFNIARLAIPLIFMPLTLVATFFLAKAMKGDKVAYISTIVLATLPLFWDIGNTALVDVPLTAFFTLALLFWYMGTESHKDWLVPAGIFTFLAILTKLTGVLILPIALTYILINRKWSLFKTWELWVGLACIPILLAYIQLSLHAGWNLTQLHNASVIPFYLNSVLILGLSPVLLLIIGGLFMIRSLKYLWIPIGIFLLFWGIQGRFFDARQFFPVFPLLCVMVAVVFEKLWVDVNHIEGPMAQSLSVVVPICLLGISLINTLYISSYHERTNYGVPELSRQIQSLSGTIGCDTEAITYYLQATNPNVKEAFAWKTAYPYAEPVYSLEGLDYIILSIYGEEYRNNFAPSHAKFCFVPLLFETGKGSQLPDVLTPFTSDLFKSCEAKHERISEINTGQQPVFVIYKCGVK